MKTASMLLTAFRLGHLWPAPGTWGSTPPAAIAFLLTAVVVYFLIVVPMNRLADKRAEKIGTEDEPAELAPDVALLTEIRDLLARGDESATRSD